MTTLTLEVWPHYKVSEIKSIKDIKSIFPDGKANVLNWFFASTSGIHGSGATLDDIEKYFGWNGEEPLEVEDNYLTVLVVQPRLCVLRYGAFEIQPEDLEYLRELVRSTLSAVRQSQLGNT